MAYADVGINTTCGTPGAVLAARGGANLAELMGRLGHGTAAAALRDQHGAHDADASPNAALISKTTLRR